MTETVQGGTRANKTGTVLERFIASRLADSGYVLVPRDMFIPVRINGQPIYTHHYNIGESVYGTQQFCDFIVYHPQKWPDNLIIESKWQQSGGSVDEKLPYLVLNVQTRYKCPTVVVLDGGGYKKGADRWIRSQAGTGSLLHVFSMSEFATWANNSYL